ncbi:MAG: hypothetical protein E7552_00915 [Ruminococcaceae bacterium]|nr:hypothetical protein [Oscillospiraceae bacterium]
MNTNQNHENNNDRQGLLKRCHDLQKAFLLPLLGLLLGIAILVLCLHTKSSILMVFGLAIIIYVLRIHPTVRKIYHTADREFLQSTFKTDLFYGGLSETNKLLVKTTKAAFGNIRGENIHHCFSIYLNVFIRSHGGLSPEYSTPQYILERVLKKFSHLPQAAVKLCATVSLEYIYHHEPQLKKKHAQQSELAQLLHTTQKYVADMAPKNAHLCDLHLQDEDYGLVSDKPIFVAGFDEAKKYLSRLTNADNVAPNIRRLGSMTEDGISAPVDIYSLTFDNGEELRIYVSNYGTKTSTVAPRGLVLRSERTK